MKRSFLYATIIFVAVSLSASAFADDAKISPDLRSYTSTTKTRVIVQFSSSAQTTCGGLLGLLGCVTNAVLNLGGDILGDLPLVNGVLAELDGNGIQTLSNDPDVTYISADRPLVTLSNDAAAAINAPVAWKSDYTGSGIGVALIDSGVNSHRDLLSTGLLSFSRVVYNQSFVPGSSSAADQYGHGTHIAGLIAGNGASSTGLMYSKTFKGIAPNAKIINLRVLDQNGTATDSTVISAIDKAISLKSTYNIRVINLSLGRGVFESYKLDPLCQAVEKAWKSGIVVVVAAGNNARYQPTDGYATITSPGNDPYALTVGSMKPMDTATRTDDLIASYSSKGPTLIDHIVKPDIVAPGNLLISTETSNTTLYNAELSNLVPQSYYIYGGSSRPSTAYFTLSGTSMATGVVSGAVADLLQAHPGLTPDQVKARLMKSASKTFPQSSSVYDPSTGVTYMSHYDIFTVGAGYLDLAAALASTDTANGTAISPTAVYDPSTGDVFLSRDSSTVWDTSKTWSAPSVYGPSVFIGSNVMWGATTSSGTNVMWGASALSGTNVMWGADTSAGFDTIWSNNVMWGASGSSGTNVMWGAGGAYGTNVMWGAGTSTGEN
jgi:serine protease AprX